MSLFDIFKKKKAVNAADDTADFAEALMAEEAQQEVAPEEAEAVAEDAETVDDEAAEPAAEAVSKTVLIGVLDTDILPDSDDLMIIGTLRGTVRKGDTLLILESMKMENAITAPIDGIVSDVAVSVGSYVTKDQKLASVRVAEG